MWPNVQNGSPRRAADLLRHHLTLVEDHQRPGVSVDLLGHAVQLHVRIGRMNLDIGDK